MLRLHISDEPQGQPAAFGRLTLRHSCSGVEGAMPFQLGLPELVIVLLIVLVIFGAGAITSLAHDLGRGIREFREGISGEPGPKNPENAKETKS
jgi:sec-independent protein translocase protein TatA